MLSSSPRTASARNRRPLSSSGTVMCVIHSDGESNSAGNGVGPIRSTSSSASPRRPPSATAPLATTVIRRFLQPNDLRHAPTEKALLAEADALLALPPAPPSSSLTSSRGTKRDETTTPIPKPPPPPPLPSTSAAATMQQQQPHISKTRKQQFINSQSAEAAQHRQQAAKRAAFESLIASLVSEFGAIGFAPLGQVTAAYKSTLWDGGGVGCGNDVMGDEGNGGGGGGSAYRGGFPSLMPRELASDSMLKYNSNNNTTKPSSSSSSLANSSSSGAVEMLSLWEARAIEAAEAVAEGIVRRREAERGEARQAIRGGASLEGSSSLLQLKGGGKRPLSATMSKAAAAAAVNDSEVKTPRPPSSSKTNNNKSNNAASPPSTPRRMAAATAKRMHYVPPPIVFMDKRAIIKGSIGGGGGMGGGASSSSSSPSPSATSTAATAASPVPAALLASRRRNLPAHLLNSTTVGVNFGVRQRSEEAAAIRKGFAIAAQFPMGSVGHTVALTSVNRLLSYVASEKAMTANNRGSGEGADCSSASFAGGRVGPTLMSPTTTTDFDHFHTMPNSQQHNAGGGQHITFITAGSNDTSSPRKSRTASGGGVGFRSANLYIPPPLRPNAFSPKQSASSSSSSPSFDSSDMKLFLDPYDLPNTNTTIAAASAFLKKNGIRGIAGGASHSLGGGAGGGGGVGGGRSVLASYIRRPVAGREMEIKATKNEVLNLRRVLNEVQLHLPALARLQEQNNNNLDTEEGQAKCLMDIFSIIDEDGSGEIDEEEFVTFGSKIGGETAKVFSRRLFRRIMMPNSNGHNNHANDSHSTNMASKSSGGGGGIGLDPLLDLLFPNYMKARRAQEAMAEDRRREVTTMPKHWQDTFDARDIEELHRTFCEIDANGNGSISAEELAMYCEGPGALVSPRTGGPAPLKRYEEHVSRFDTNGDGHIDFKEFAEMQKFYLDATRGNAKGGGGGSQVRAAMGGIQPPQWLPYFD